MNGSILRLSKVHNYYPPKIYLDKKQDTESLLKELKKIELFLRAPEFNYLVREKYMSKEFESKE
tara:strand:- start:150 stop:341 length:192 start_codon:yes stop_codon:yes gene_type:complete